MVDAQVPRVRALSLRLSIYSSYFNFRITQKVLSYFTYRIYVFSEIIGLTQPKAWLTKRDGVLSRMVIFKTQTKLSYLQFYGSCPSLLQFWLTVLTYWILWITTIVEISTNVEQHRPEWRFFYVYKRIEFYKDLILCIKVH